MLVTAKILLFWQVVAFQNIKIILDMIQGCPSANLVINSVSKRFCT